MDQAPLLPGSTATGERDRLITAFAQVAAECGVQNTTVEAVVKAADVAENTFYLHFTGLKDCFVKSYEHGAGVLLGKMRAAYQAEPVWRDGLRALLRTLLTELAAAPSFARLALVEVSKAGPDMRETQIRVTERFREALHDPAMPYIPI